MSYRESNISEEDRTILRAMKKQDIADAVGMPGESDKANIEQIIRNYELFHPGEVAKVIKQAKSEKPLIKSVNAVGSTRTSLPIGLMRQIEESYPGMFTSKKHFFWFMQTFKSLDLERD